MIYLSILGPYFVILEAVPIFGHFNMTGMQSATYIRTDSLSLCQGLMSKCGKAIGLRITVKKAGPSGESRKGGDLRSQDGRLT